MNAQTNEGMNKRMKEQMKEWNPVSQPPHCYATVIIMVTLFWPKQIFSDFLSAKILYLIAILI